MERECYLCGNPTKEYHYIEYDVVTKLGIPGKKQIVRQRVYVHKNCRINARATLESAWIDRALVRVWQKLQVKP